MQSLVATREFVDQVAKDLDLARETAERVADYIVDQVDRRGGEFDVRDVTEPHSTPRTPRGSWCLWAAQPQPMPPRQEDPPCPRPPPSAPRTTR
jgi:hypothetical protein